MALNPPDARTVRLLRAKAHELEALRAAHPNAWGDEGLLYDLAADIALVAHLLAEHMEHCGQ